MDRLVELAKEMFGNLSEEEVDEKLANDSWTPEEEERISFAMWKFQNEEDCYEHDCE